MNSITVEWQHEVAFAFLRELWRQGDVCERLPADLTPQTKSEAYRVQALVEGESTLPLVAWKIAATSSAGQKHIGVSGPLVGRHIKEQIVPSGGVIPFARNLYATDFGPAGKSVACVGRQTIRSKSTETVHAQ